jgi:hypothetical protein
MGELQFLQKPMEKHPIIVDEEFSALIPPMSADSVQVRSRIPLSIGTSTLTKPTGIRWRISSP